MRFYFDENMPEESAKHLARRKHSVHFASTYGYRTLDDAAHYALAKRKKRILVTMDQGYIDNRRFPLQRQWGIVILKVRREIDCQKVNAILDRVLRHFKTMTDFYETKIIASERGYRRITREGKEGGEWPEWVVLREEDVAYGEELPSQGAAQA
jgi:predicted nuclease of predicted toxin-antitoxin system